MKAFTSAVVLSSAALLLAPAVSYGQAGSNAYVVGRDGNPIIAGRTGECVRTRLWTPTAAPCGRAAAPAAPAAARPMKR